MKDSADFFISYTQADGAWAAWLAWHLEENGFTTRHQAWDFNAGSNFVLEMQKAAQGSRHTIAVISPAFLESKFTQAEWAAAFASDPEGDAGALIPVRVREVDLSGILAPIVYIDLVGLSEEEARKELLAGVSGSRRKPAAKPPFPAATSERWASGGDEQPPFPGEMPPVWNAVSASRNFEGRNDLLKGIVEQLHPGAGKENGSALALVGLGGVGKTQVAATYAWNERSRYDVVWWIRAKESATRIADFGQLARAMGLDVEEGPDAEVEAVKEWLLSHRRWLLVFDDAPNAESIRELLPVRMSGNVLITSRRATGWRAVASPLEVQSWDPASAASFLRRRTGREEEGASLEVATALGGFPLAMEQAGAYVDAMGITLGDYWERLSANAGEPLEAGSPSEYEGTVKSTWQLSFEEVEKDAKAKLLLQCFAYLAPDQIPNVILSALLPDALTRDEVLRGLLEFSLVAVDPPNLRMHVLVQQAVRVRASDREIEQAQKLLLEALLEVIPGADPDQWPLGISLLPHVVEALEWGMAGEEERGVALRLADRLAVFHHGRGEMKGALTLAEMIREKVGDDPELARSNLTSLGILRMSLGDAEGAQAAFEAALASCVEEYGENHSLVGRTLDNLGIVLRRQGKISAAIDSHQRALRIFEDDLGPDSVDLAPTCVNLGNALRMAGRLDEAERCLRRSLDIKIREYGQSDYRLARTYDSLASIIFEKGDPAGAKHFYERALEIGETNLGRDHPEVGATLSNLSLVLVSEGEAEKAQELQGCALGIFKAVYGESHPFVAQAETNLGEIARHLGRPEEAKAYFTAAIDLFEQVLPLDHPELIPPLVELGSLLADLGEPKAAEEQLQRARAIAQNCEPPSPSLPNIEAKLERLRL